MFKLSNLKFWIIKEDEHIHLFNAKDQSIKTILESKFEYESFHNLNNTFIKDDKLYLIDASCISNFDSYDSAISLYEFDSDLFIF
jgi:hypothetical protein